MVNRKSSPLDPPMSAPVHYLHPALLELLEEDVAEKCQYARGEQPDGTLVDGDDVFQGVDALLHGVGVDVVINGGPDAPHGPHSIHQRFDRGRDHRSALHQPPHRCRRPASDDRLSDVRWAQ